MRNMDSLVDDYRAERKAAKKKTWFEQIVHKLVGGQLASKYITERKLPKIQLVVVRLKNETINRLMKRVQLPYMFDIRFSHDSS